MARGRVSVADVKNAVVEEWYMFVCLFGCYHYSGSGGGGGCGARKMVEHG